MISLMTIQQEKDLAVQHGFECIRDDKRGYGWCKFQKDAVHVWTCSTGWARAELIDNRFCNHEYYKTLKDALNRENKVRGPYWKWADERQSK